jgi:N6-adenosine-specific RNA methylase IME4
MAKFRVLVADPAWEFGDNLTMSDVKRGSSSNYDTLTIEDLKKLPVSEICTDDAVLALWCPSALLLDGLEVMKAWGFRQTQTHVWVKTKKIPLRSLVRELVLAFKVLAASPTKANFTGAIKEILSKFRLDNVLAFGMGRLFRQTHEVALVGVRGRIYDHLKNKSQRSVHFHPATKHSTKPEALQYMLEKMFPRAKRLEMFARRDRPGWTCVGLECPSTMGEDIRDSLNRLKS